MNPNPLQTALDLAREAGAVLLEHLQHPREIIPNASILAEESGAYRATSSERWIVDPLDGTTNFAHGYPAFCMSIAYECDGDALLCTGFKPSDYERNAAQFRAAFGRA